MKIKTKNLILVLSFLLINISVIKSQEYNGQVFSEDGTPVQYANIGVPIKNIGTVSDSAGQFELDISELKDNDTLLFSSIGYLPYKISIKDLKAKKETIYLSKKTYEIQDVNVVAKYLKLRRKGIKSASKAMTGKLVDKLGYELGVRINNNKRAKLKTFYLNIGICKYDSIFFRVNVYSITKDKEYVNILKEPIYLSASQKETETTIEMDISTYNIYVQSDFLLTIEYVKNLGDDGLFFCGSMTKSCYYRETSHGAWKKVPFAPSLSVDMLFEK